MTQSILPISIIIPTYQREQVLIDTLTYLLKLQTKAAEIIIVDQTSKHEIDVERQLREWQNSGLIKLINLPKPSIPYAMNEGLLAAECDIVLYLDDDIIPEQKLVLVHWQAHQEHSNVIVAGRVVQPWEEAQNVSLAKSPFSVTESGWRDQFMGGNFSIHTSQLLNLGGFDENFVKVAYQFEAEFAYRFSQAGGKIRFEAEACIHHLKASSGGTRSHGHHLTTTLPNHSVGAYYYLLCAKNLQGRFIQFLVRPIKSVATRYHLSHPWSIPMTLVAEFRGMFWATRLFLRGPSHIDRHVKI